MVTTRRTISRAVVIGWMVVTATACGGDAGDSTVGDTAPPVAAAAVATPTDPCSMIPLAEWESVMALSGLQLDRDGAETCDVLDDANGRVAGSIKLLDPSILDATRSRFETVDVSGVGDDAIWVASSQLQVRHGNEAFSIMVNPIAVERNREAAERLARVALSAR